MLGFGIQEGAGEPGGGGERRALLLGADAGASFAAARAPLLLSLSVIVLYFLLTVAMPIYNRIVFKGLGKHLGGFPYPLVATWLQMLGASLMLVLTDAVLYLTVRRRRPSPVVLRPVVDSNGPSDQNGPREEAETTAEIVPQSWFFQSGWRVLGAKVWYLLPVAVAFAGVMGLSNVGLFEVALNLHVLLRSSEIAWVVFFAWPINRVLPTPLEGLCCVLLFAGAIMLSVNWSEDELKKLTFVKTWPLITNIGSTIAGGIMLTTLRRALLRLRELNPSTGVIEVSAMKMTLATIVLLPFTLALEMTGWKLLFQHFGVTLLLVLGGVILTLAYQTTVVALMSFSLATSVGVLGTVKVIPQTLLAIWLFGGFTPTALNISGMAVIFVSSLVYGGLRLRSHREKPF
jgi:hypothetical protein